MSQKKSPIEPGEFKPRRPDYNLSAMDKKTGCKGPIGAAWKNEDGTITLKLNPFVVLETARMELVVMLYPTNGGEEPRE